MPPDAFGPFRVLHQIGNGGLGPVFRAYDSDRDRLVAIKVFRLDLPPERVHQLVAEFEQLIGAELRHPAIAAPRGTGIDAANNAFLAQDFAAADSLDIVLRENGRAPLDRTLRVASQLADALDYAAERHVLHGSLHPRDILLSEDDIRIVGVGVSRALERAGVASPVRRPYSAPERINEEGWDQRADVFSLAAIVYEMLCGRRVTGTGSEAADGVTDIVGSDAAAVQRVFALALAADPMYRFATATAFTDALKEAAGFASLAQANTAEVSVPRPKPRRPRSKFRVVASSEPSVDGASSPPPGEAEPELPLITFADELEQELANDIPILRLPVQKVPAPTPVAIESVGSAALLEEPFSPTPDPDPLLDASSPAATLQTTIEHEPDVVAAPEMPLPEMPLLDVPVEPPVAALDLHEVDEPAFEPMPALEQPTRLPAFLESPAPRVAPVSSSHSPVWPIGVAAVIGMAIGFGVGYSVAIRDRAVSAPTTMTSPASASVTAPAVAADVPLPPTVEQPRDVAPLPKPTASDVPPSAAGRVVVRSTPSGARVLVDGKDRGQTPVAIRELSEGEHRIRIVRDGYTAAERRVLLTASRPAQSLTVLLAREPHAREKATTPKRDVRPAADAGTLIVESRPQGATVVVDGRAVGTTPISLGDVRAGNHSVQLERDGYRTWAGSIAITGGEQNRVTASLEK